MHKDYIALARTNRLFALAQLNKRKSARATLSNVHPFPVPRAPLFVTSRGKRPAQALAA